MIKALLVMKGFGNRELLVLARDVLDHGHRAHEQFANLQGKSVNMFSISSPCLDLGSLVFGLPSSFNQEHA